MTLRHIHQINGHSLHLLQPLQYNDMKYYFPIVIFAILQETRQEISQISSDCFTQVSKLCNQSAKYKLLHEKRKAEKIIHYQLI